MSVYHMHGDDYRGQRVCQVPWNSIFRHFWVSKRLLVIKPGSYAIAAKVLIEVAISPTSDVCNILLQFIYFFLYIYLLCVCEYTCHSLPVKIRGQLKKTEFSFYPVYPEGLNSSHKAASTSTLCTILYFINKIQDIFIANKVFTFFFYRKLLL